MALHTKGEKKIITKCGIPKLKVELITYKIMSKYGILTGNVITHDIVTNECF